MDTNEHEFKRYGGVTREMNELRTTTSGEFVSIRVYSRFKSGFRVIGEVILGAG